MKAVDCTTAGGSLRLELRGKNGNLWHAIYDRYDSMLQFIAVSSGLDKTDYVQLIGYMNLSRSPWGKREPDKLRAGAKRIAHALGIHPVELFPSELYAGGPLPMLVAEVEPAMLMPVETAKALPAATLNPEELMELAESEEDPLTRVLGTLTPREEGVLKMRFGLETGREETLEDIAEQFDCTRERIRQIEGNALRKLRHPLRNKSLKELIA